MTIDFGHIITSSAALELGSPKTDALLIGANVMVLAATGVLIHDLGKTRRLAQRDALRRAWRLEQMLPNRGFSR